MTDDLTTLVCLFHHQDQAQAAVRDLHETGIPQSSISLIGGSETNSASGSAESSLEQLGIPSRDLAHLLSGVNHGGVIVAISAIADHVSKVESIFARHKATKIDEAVINEHGNDRDYDAAPLAAAIPAAAATPARSASGETVIPIVEEEMVVGKRAVNAGGVRVYRRVVEIPVEESVTLREEHVTVDRQPVNRAVSQADLAMAGDRTIELTETAEEAVVGKSARVVEEVRVGKEASEHSERIQDSVRKTEIEVEEVAPGTQRGGTTSGRL